MIYDFSAGGAGNSEEDKRMGTSE